MPRKSAAVTAATKGAARAKTAPAKAVKPPVKAVKAAALKPAAKPAAKTTSKSISKPGLKSAVKAAAKALSAPAPRKTARKAAPAAPRAPALASAPSARPVLVRDSFTMPEQEYAVLADVKGACLRAGIEVKKSELLRVGVALLGQVDIATLKAVLGALPQLKTGRPPAGA